MTHEIYEVIRIFFFVFLVVVAHKLAKESAERYGRLHALWVAALWCLGIALAAWAKFSPSCPSDDTTVCERLVQKQLVDALTFWLLLLATPVFFGVMEARQYALQRWSKLKDTGPVVGELQ